MFCLLEINVWMGSLCSAEIYTCRLLKTARFWITVLPGVILLYETPCLFLRCWVLAIRVYFKRVLRPLETRDGVAVGGFVPGKFLAARRGWGSSIAGCFLPVLFISLRIIRELLRTYWAVNLSNAKPEFTSCRLYNQLRYLSYAVITASFHFWIWGLFFLQLFHNSFPFSL